MGGNARASTVVGNGGNFSNERKWRKKRYVLKHA